LELLSFFQYLFFFFSFLSLFQYFLALSLYFGDDQGTLKIFEEKNKLQKYFGWDGSAYNMNMKVGELRIYWRWTHTPEWTYAHQYESGGVVDINFGVSSLDVKYLEALGCLISLRNVMLVVGRLMYHE
jgi:hypothetical protein